MGELNCWQTSRRGLGKKTPDTPYLIHVKQTFYQRISMIFWSQLENQNEICLLNKFARQPYKLPEAYEANLQQNIRAKV